MLKEVTAVISLSFVCVTAAAETPPAPAAAATPAARAAIANRRAVFTLIGNSFRPVAGILRQGGTSSPADLAKYASRVALLADFLPEAFPDISSSGDTRAKPDIWSNRLDFDKRLQDFQAHAAQLGQAGARHDEAALKSAASAVAQDCKSCHDRYRSE